ncbi:MAG TPA: hypothetical protein VGO93_04695 [Candidatus Xenobia bacterium]|jgi:hypothetical protein
MALLRAAGHSVHALVMTRPPRARIGVGVLRVIQQRPSADGMVLVASYEGYED